MIGGLRSAELKLNRAKKHLRAIKRSIAKYSASRPHRFTKKGMGKRKLDILKPPPQEIAVLAGEMIYQMRSALDHLAFELVKTNPSVSALDPKWREHCQFPLRIKLPNDSAPPLARNGFSNDLPGISDKAFETIERMQPYYGAAAVDSTNGCLRLLVMLSNIDKHRHLNLVRARVRQKQHIRYESGFTSGSWQFLDRGTITEHPGDKCSSDRPAYVNRRYTTVVTFNEREHLGNATDVPLDFLLFLILYHIEFFIVPALLPLIKES